MERATVALIALVGILLAGLHDAGARQQEPSENTIVPGVRLGAFTLGMSKDEVLRKLGEPEAINFAGEHFRLDDLPARYESSPDEIDLLTVLKVHNPYEEYVLKQQ